MTIQEHISDRLLNPQSFELMPEENKRVRYEGIAEQMWRRASSTKFRRSPLSEPAEKQIREAIRLNVEANRPLVFAYPFGGYKTWRVPSFPRVDWAEFLTLSHVIRFARFVTEGYAPGAKIIFSSDDVVIEQIDNYPRRDLDEYIKSFRKLVAEFSKHLPANVSLELKQIVPDVYSASEYTPALESIVADMKRAGMTKEYRAAAQSGFDFNFLAKGKVDYTHASKEELEGLFDDLIYYSVGYLKLPKRRAFVRAPENIVVFSMPISNAIDIGSTSVSKAKFWAGTGVIERHDGKLYDRILSPKQYELVKKELKPEAITVSGLEELGAAPVYEGRLEFRR
jgi:hypothetical protein